MARVNAVVRELTHALLTYSCRNLHQYCTRNKYALIFLVNRPCEPWQNQIFKFVHLLGNWTPSLWPEHLLSLWQRQVWMHRQLLGWRGEECSTQLIRLESCFALTLFSMFVTSPKHPPDIRLYEHSFLLSCFFLHPGVQVEASTQGKSSKQIPKIPCWPLAEFSAFLHLNKWQNLTSVGKSCYAMLSNESISEWLVPK